jgi:hypothetical protein
MVRPVETTSAAQLEDQLLAALAPALTEQRAALQVQRDEQAALLRRIDRLERLLAHSRAALERARQTPTSAYCP